MFGRKKKEEEEKGVSVDYLIRPNRSSPQWTRKLTRRKNKIPIQRTFSRAVLLRIALQIGRIYYVVFSS